MWDLLLGVIADEIYGHLDQQKLLQKCYQRNKKDARKNLEELVIYIILIGR